LAALINQRWKTAAIIIRGKVTHFDVACVHIPEVLKTLKESIKSRRPRAQGTWIEYQKTEPLDPLCCARTTNGHAAAAPLISAIKSRRL